MRRLKPGTGQRPSRTGRFTIRVIIAAAHTVNVSTGFTEAPAPWGGGSGAGRRGRPSASLDRSHTARSIS